MTHARRLCALLLLCPLLFPDFRAEEKKEEPAAAEKKDDKKDEKKEDKSTDKTTSHEISLPNGKLAYKVTAGYLPLLTKEEGTKASAQVFYIAYTQQNPSDPATRPVTFSFNGGPGSSSVWLHLGCFGPKRVWFDDQGNPPAPPGRLVENPHTLLDQTDLVFIDPVSTGYSRAEKGEDAKQFHGLRGDIEAVGEFIRLYLTRNHRWLSPKLLAGESYGTTRAAGLADHLRDRLGIDLNGLLLISSVLDFQTISPNESNLLPYALFLPTYTSTAWHHGRLKGDWAKTLAGAQARAESFALQEYLPALAKGGALTPDERKNLAAKLAELTGLPAETILEQNLHLHPFWFMGELLRPEGRVVGRMDARYTAPLVRAFGQEDAFDPSLSTWMAPYTAALNDYVRRELAFESDLPYEVLSPKVHPWKWDGTENKYLALQGDLRSVLVRNPALHVFVASGDYDLATPYFATDFTFRQLAQPGVPLALTHKHYPAGHMMYVHADSLAQLRADMRVFLEQALKPGAVMPVRSR